MLQWKFFRLENKQKITDPVTLSHQDLATFNAWGVFREIFFHRGRVIEQHLRTGGRSNASM